MSLETVLEIFWRGMSVGMGIFELRVLWDDSLQSWRFGVAFGVNIPPIYCNVINRKKITFDKGREDTDKDGHPHKDGERADTPIYIYYRVIYIIQGLPLSPSLCPSFCPLCANSTNFSSRFCAKGRKSGFSSKWGLTAEKIGCIMSV